MDKSYIGKNIQKHRYAKGLTQKELSDKAEISLVQLGQIERGKSVPRVNNIQKISKALDIRFEELLIPVRELHSVRFRAFKKLKSRNQILSEVAQWIDNYNFLEEILNQNPNSTLDKLSEKCVNISLDLNKSIRASELAREFFGLRLDEPIFDVCGLLESKGIKIYERPLRSDNFFGLSVGKSDGGPAIVVNTHDTIPVERWIFSAIHELGHLILHTDSYCENETCENKDEELEANVFASHFLMPEKALIDEWEESRGIHFVDRVFKIKRMFHVSYKTVLYRLSQHIDSGINIWIEFQNAYRMISRKSLMKKDEPDSLSKDIFRSTIPENDISSEPSHLEKYDFSETKLHSLTREAIEKDEISISRGAEILRLPLPDFRNLMDSWVDKFEYVR